jgi:hypothetical protein
MSSKRRAQERPTSKAVSSGNNELLPRGCIFPSYSVTFYGTYWGQDSLGHIQDMSAIQMPILAPHQG